MKERMADFVERAHRSRSTQERLAQVEGEFRGIVYAPVHSPTDETNAIIHRLVIRVAREAHAACLDDFNRGVRILASEAYPLPPKRVLREEPDPESAIVRWRCSDRGIEYNNLVGGAGWQVLTQDGTVGKFAITGPRIDLWHSLKHNPYREVPDNGDE